EGHGEEQAGPLVDTWITPLLVSASSGFRGVCLRASEGSRSCQARRWKARGSSLVTVWTSPRIGVRQRRDRRFGCRRPKAQGRQRRGGGGCGGGTGRRSRS